MQNAYNKLEKKEKSNTSFFEEKKSNFLTKLTDHCHFDKAGGVKAEKPATLEVKNNLQEGPATD